MLDRFYQFVGPLVVIVMVAWRLPTYGSRWHLGRWMMPQTLVGPDGLHYPNGEPIDPATLSIVQTGWEPETYLAGFSVLLLFAFYLWRVVVQMERNRMQLMRGRYLLMYYEAKRRGEIRD